MYLVFGIDFSNNYPVFVALFMKTFLTAEWRKLVNLTYEVDAALLEEYLPDGLTIDTTLNGKAHVSLVAFDFTNTRVKGIKIPFHVNFPEINLRFYVRYQGHVGVVFIREYVPRFWIAEVANRIYNEPYKCIPMQSVISFPDAGQKIQTQHQFKISGNTFQITASAVNKLLLPSDTSIEHYFKEHEWGFGKNHSGKTMCYRVEHPVWQIYPFENFKINIDFGKVYGSKWAFLNKKEPDYKVFAEGSAVSVFEAITMKDFESIVSK
jgi:hypothetical protein